MNQKLRHGKALCGKVFGKFVETFNWLVDFSANLKGDADVNEATGSIKVDRTSPFHPIIRFTGTQSSGGEQAQVEDMGCFKLTKTDGGFSVSNKFCQLGGYTVEASGDTTISAAGTYGVTAEVSGSGATATFGAVSLSDQSNLNHVIIPIYQIGNSDGVLVVEIDYRLMPTVSLIERY